MWSIMSTCCISLFGERACHVLLNFPTEFLGGCSGKEVCYFVLHPTFFFLRRRYLWPHSDMFFFLQWKFFPSLRLFYENFSFILSRFEGVRLVMEIVNSVLQKWPHPGIILDICPTKTQLILFLPVFFVFFRGIPFTPLQVRSVDFRLLT